jgi:hypothetical protein
MSCLLSSERAGGVVLAEEEGAGRKGNDNG